MRLSHRQVQDPKEIEKIVNQCRVCRIAMVDDAAGRPYIVPVNFGYAFADGLLCLYFHGAQEGRKADIFRRGGEVCFEMDIEEGYSRGKEAGTTTCFYSSIIGYGTVEILENPADKRAGLDELMRHVIGAGDYQYSDDALDRVGVFRIQSREYTAKRRSAEEKN